MKKTKKILMAVVLCAILVVGLMPTAFAAGDIINGTEQNPAQVAITKVLKMGELTDTPAATFKYTVAKKSVDTLTTTEALATMPDIGEKSIVYSAADTGTTAARLKTVSKETTNILDGITWPHAGVYEYTITEQANTYTIADATVESMTYSQGEYDLAVYVANKADGTGLYVSAIGCTIIVKDSETQGEVGDKVDPTPGGDPAVEGDYGKMEFTNTYVKNNGGGGDPEDPNKRALEVSKAVAGNLANQSMYFTYNMTVTKPVTVTTTPVYKGYVVDANNAVVTAADNAANATAVKTDANNKKYIEFTSGTSTEFKLKHNQKLVFTDVEVGSLYTATETGAATYIPTAKITVDGTAVTPDLSATVGQNLATGERVIGEDANSAAYTNTLRDTTPTGIILNNLPFVILIVAAIAAIVLFTVIKGRRRATGR